MFCPSYPTKHERTPAEAPTFEPDGHRDIEGEVHEYSVAIFVVYSSCGVREKCDIREKSEKEGRLGGDVEIFW
jgi:hypothetical protein